MGLNLDENDKKGFLFTEKGILKKITLIIGVWMFLILTYYSFIMIHDRIVSGQDWDCFDGCMANGEQEAPCYGKCNIGGKKFMYSERAIHCGFQTESVFSLMETRIPVFYYSGHSKYPVDPYYIFNMFLFLFFTAVVFSRRRKLSRLECFLCVTVLVVFVVMSLADIYLFRRTVWLAAHSAPEDILFLTKNLLVLSWTIRSFMPILAGLFLMWNILILRQFLYLKKIGRKNKLTS